MARGFRGYNSRGVHQSSNYGNHYRSNYGGRMNNTGRSSDRYGAGRYGSGGGFGSSGSHYVARNNRDRFHRSVDGRHDSTKKTNYRLSDNSRDHSNERKRMRQDDYRRNSSTAIRGDRTPPPPPLISNNSSSMHATTSSSRNSRHNTNDNRDNSRSRQQRPSPMGPPLKRPLIRNSFISRLRGGGTSTRGNIRTMRGGTVRHHHHHIRREHNDLRIMRRKLLFAHRKDRARVLKIQRLTSSLRNRRLDRRLSRSPHRRMPFSRNRNLSRDDDDDEKRSSKRETDAGDSDVGGDDDYTKTDGKKRSSSSSTKRYSSSKPSSSKYGEKPPSTTDNEALNSADSQYDGPAKVSSADKKKLPASPCSNTSSSIPYSVVNKENDERHEIVETIAKDKADKYPNTEKTSSVSSNSVANEKDMKKTIRDTRKRDDACKESSSVEANDAKQTVLPSCSSSSAAETAEKKHSSASLALKRDQDKDGDKDRNRYRDDDAASGSLKRPKHSSRGSSQANTAAATSTNKERKILRPLRREERSSPLRRASKYIKLICVHCNTRCVTFKEYSYHLSSRIHKMALRQIALRQRAQLLRLRARQRIAQREIEEKCKESYDSKFCHLCRLHYRQPKAKHQLSEDHKTMKKFLMPYCSICHLAFKSPMLYETHRCSLEHIKNKARNQDSDSSGHSAGGGDDVNDHRNRNDDDGMRDIDLNKFMTVDSVGEIDDDDAGNSNSNNDANTEGASTAARRPNLDSSNHGTQTLIGSKFIKQITAFYCELCDCYSADGSTFDAYLRKHCVEKSHLRAFLRYYRENRKNRNDEKRADDHTREGDHRVAAGGGSGGGGGGVGAGEGDRSNANNKTNSNETGANMMDFDLDSASHNTPEPNDKTNLTNMMSTEAMDHDDTDEQHYDDADDDDDDDDDDDEDDDEVDDDDDGGEHDHDDDNASSVAAEVNAEANSSNEIIENMVDKLWQEIDNDLGGLLHDVGIANEDQDDEEEDESVLNIDIESEKANLKEMNGKKADSSMSDVLNCMEMDVGCGLDESSTASSASLPLIKARQKLSTRPARLVRHAKQ